MGGGLKFSWERDVDDTKFNIFFLLLALKRKPYKYEKLLLSSDSIRNIGIGFNVRRIFE